MRAARVPGIPSSRSIVRPLPEGLIESELFGHEKGAFTGAVGMRKGRFEAADGGTLFLDEVGELPLPVQGAFLRALELRRFRPVGEVREEESDFRLVAATNRDLDDMVGMDLYRSDLRFRLRGMTIHVPPLRRRAEDIPLLAEHFTARYCQRHELPNKELTPDCYAMLADYSWPGNVRELRNFAERMVILFGGKTVLPVDLPPEMTPQGKPEPSAEAASAACEPAFLPQSAVLGPDLDFKKARAVFEARYLEAKLHECGGNITRLAETIGLERSYLHRKLKGYGISSE